MPDVRISVFGGIKNNTTKKALSPSEFADGQNFYIDPFGSIIKRNGQKKVYDTSLGGTVMGIGYLLMQHFKHAHVFASLGSLWADIFDVPEYLFDEPEDDTFTGCCNYGSYPGTCITDVTATECFSEYNGIFWRYEGDCVLGGENTCNIAGTTTTTTTTTTTSSSTPTSSTSASSTTSSSTTSTTTTSSSTPTTTDSTTSTTPSSTTTTTTTTSSSTPSTTTTSTTTTTSSSTVTSTSTTEDCGDVIITEIGVSYPTNTYYITGQGFCDTRGTGKVEVQRGGVGEWEEALTYYDDQNDWNNGYCRVTFYDALEVDDVVKLTNKYGDYDTEIYA